MQEAVSTLAGGGNSSANGMAGLTCLCMLAMHHHISAQPIGLARALGLEPDAVKLPDIRRVANSLGLRANPRRISPGRIGRVPAPIILMLVNGDYATYLRTLPDGRHLILFPPQREPQLLTQEELLSKWDGLTLLVKRPLSLDDTPRRFGFSWFVPVLWKFRSTLAEVLIAAFVIQLFAIATPLFSQVIIDKVLTHKSISTLNVLAVGMLGLIVFDGILNLLKAWLLSHTTNRIDVLLGSRLFGHLVHIPLRFFEMRRVGETLSRVREMEQIRQFLTGQPLTTAIDTLFIIVFVALMLVYSPLLTLVVVLALPFFVGVSLVIRPLFRGRLETLFQRNAASQSFLVEAVTGMQTVKAMALERIFARKWEATLARQVHAASEVQHLSGTASALSNVIQRCTTLAILWFGAGEVMDNQLTVGKLIAFQMIAGQVINPVMRIVSLWQDFQRVSLSVDRLGDLMNTPGEPFQANKTSLPQLRGDIELDAVNFRYKPEGRRALQDFKLTIPTGTTVGLVGRSGSGKSTLTRLLQRLYLPESGRILIDGMDIGQLDPLWLRRQIGVVLQDNFLFSGSIYDNIAVQWPGAPMQAVVKAAQLAGAHEFITELSDGYDTEVGERGTSLSGGQRQRVAIARALLTNPRILIFDEATSALDYESERIIQDNMKAISQGRTVLIIAHRLSTIAHCDTIVVMDRGEIREQGTHAELLAATGLYHHLFAQQSSPSLSVVRQEGA